MFVFTHALTHVFWSVCASSCFCVIVHWLVSFVCECVDPSVVGVLTILLSSARFVHCFKEY